MRKILTFGLVGFGLSGCFEVQKMEPFYSFDGLEYSQRQDFTLANHVQYFEVRVGDLEEDPFGITPETIFQFDAYAYENLDIGIQIDLDMTKTTVGFASDCANGVCPIYISLVGDEVSVVDTSQELLEFLGSLDTPSEFALWLMQWDYEVLRYRYNGNDSFSFIVSQGSTKYELLTNSNGDILQQVML